MQKVAVVTDCTSTISKEIAEKHHIRVVPFYVYLDEKQYLDMVELSPEEFYKWQRETKRMAKSSAAAPEDYLAAFREVSARAEAIVCPTITTGMSNAYERAVLAKKDLPHIPIEVIDTKTTTGALGLICLACARAAASGEDLAQVVKVAEDVRAKMNTMVMVDTLHYLAKGGRIGRAQAFLGSMLNMKPILQISPDGVFDPLERARSRPKAMERLVELMSQRVKPGTAVHMWINHGDMPEEAGRLKEKITSRFNCLEFYSTLWTPIMAAYTGPVLALSFYAEG